MTTGVAATAMVAIVTPEPIALATAYPIGSRDADLSASTEVPFKGYPSTIEVPDLRERPHVQIPSRRSSGS